MSQTPQAWTTCDDLDLKLDDLESAPPAQPVQPVQSSTRGKLKSDDTLSDLDYSKPAPASPYDFSLIANRGMTPVQEKFVVNRDGKWNGTSLNRR